MFGKTAKRVMATAGLLYAGAFAIYLVGNELNQVPSGAGHVAPSWTWWDYAACAMLLCAVGCTFAAIRLRKDDGENY